ncbi:FtsX-like permease family protein [Thalassoroseus pseudoceratinae]|uniref:FtsX-like permease family protein n=1 Tax=Thalassoroseus pseudoceratinae TaxID=2713176 RepID=UPI001421977A|nr:FtsX-like permease family protein [Thalassoroseus pseudoceratinae]
MSNWKLRLQSLLYYWRTHLAVLLGVLAGTAVIGGALVVGDSVRGSLETMSRERLGNIDFALSSYRFFREDLAPQIASQPEFAKRFQNQGTDSESPSIAPAIALVGAVERELSTADESNEQFARAGQVNVWGIDERFWSLTNHGDASSPTDDQVLLSAPLAKQLASSHDGSTKPIKPGDSVRLWIELPASIPRDSLLGDREEQASVELDLTVAAILPEASGVGRLELRPSQQLPLNAFIPLDTLQKALGLAAYAERNRQTQQRIEHPARVNALFTQAKSSSMAENSEAVTAAESLDSLLRKSMSFDDLGLRVSVNKEYNYLSLESDQQILSNPFAETGKAVAKELGWATSSVLIYVANELRNSDSSQVVYRSRIRKDDGTYEEQQGEGYSMYTLVAGLPFPQPAPFEPFPYLGEEPKWPLADDEIILNDYLAEDLKVSVGDTVAMTYYVVGSHVVDADGNIPEKTKSFRVAAIVKDEGAAVDGGLVPAVKGVTDARTFDEIQEPFPMKREIITERDENFWEMYPATPKAFLSLAAAQELWNSRYGNVTSLRMTPKDSDARMDLEAAKEEFVSAYLKKFDPADAQLTFLPIKYRSLQAASGTTDFSGLFFGFSFFLILSATILIGLLFRLGVDQRATNIGLLTAVGFSPQRVRREFLGEGLIVVGLGGLLGILAAVGYAELMVYGLKTWWYGAIGTRFLDVYVKPLSLLIGFAIATGIALATIWWSLRKLNRISTRELLAGVSEPTQTTEQEQSQGTRSFRIAIIGAGISLAVLIAAVLGLVPSSEAFMGISWQVVAFFVVGMMMLTASIAFLNWYTGGNRGVFVRGSGWTGSGRLGIRNASRNRSRSNLTTALIASATFVIVAIAAGHRNPATETPDKNSGNGGFTLVASTSTPILYDLSTPGGRDEVELPISVNEAVYQDQPAKLEAARDDAVRKNHLLDEMTVMPFRVRPGENASCLNIYQTRLPTILGVPNRMIERGGFKFIGADRENPWTLLEEPPEEVTLTTTDGQQHTVPAYPVFGDMNTLQYSLHKAVGDLIPVPTEGNPTHALRIVGMFDGSVFQGVLTMAESYFTQLYPEQVGYEYFLVDASPSETAELRNLLESRLHDYGFDAEPVGQRLQKFLEVQNTYLSTFEALGGLGLLLGTLGLATVMLRNVLERRGELALLRSVGFVKSRIAWLVLCENAFLLVWGLASGTISALVAMAPHLTSTGADVPWPAVGVILFGVFLVGMVAALMAVIEAVRTPILATLRSE